MSSPGTNEQAVNVNVIAHSRGKVLREGGYPDVLVLDAAGWPVVIEAKRRASYAWAEDDATDRPFFDAIGGPSPSFSRDLGDGDIVWLVPELVRTDAGFALARGHWEVLTLEASGEKLLAAETIKREAFEEALRTRLRPLTDGPRA